MSIMDTLWPWKALSKLRRENRSYLLRMADDMAEIASLKSAIRHLDAEVTAKDVRIKFQKDEIVRMNEKLKTAVFRDPKTGRLIKPPKE
jgi:hypothetical protein